MTRPVTYAVLDDHAIVVVDGPLDGTTAPDAHVALEAAINAGALRVLVDLTATPGLDDGGRAVLAAAAAALGPRGGTLVLEMPGGRTMEISDAGALRAALEP